MTTIAGRAARPTTGSDARAGVWAGARAGFRAMAPLLLAYAPLALVVGAAVRTSANPLVAWLATWTIYGGAAQLAVLDLLAHGSPWLQAALVALLVNSRLTAYATAMAPDWRAAPWSVRAAAAVMLTDAPWALAARQARGRRPYYLGAALTLFVGWPALVTTGVVAGGWLAVVPAADLLPALTIGAVVLRQLTGRRAIVVAAVVTVWAVVTTGLPAGVVLGGAAAVGAVAALRSEDAT